MICVLGNHSCFPTRFQLQNVRRRIFFLFSILQCVCMWTWTLIPPHPPTPQPSTESKNMLLYDGTICYACEYVICKHKKDVVNGLEDVYTFFIIFYFSIYWECHNPKWHQLTFIFFRGAQAPSSWSNGPSQSFPGARCISGDGKT